MEIKKWRLIQSAAGAITILGVAAMIAFLIMRPTEHEKALRDMPPKHFKFQTGQIVESVTSGQRGQILLQWLKRPDADYQVRFATPETKTNTHLLGPDGPVERSPFALVDMREFELREAAN